MDKRGIFAVHMLAWIMRILFLVVVMLAVVSLVRIYIITSVDSFDAESTLLIERLLYSPELITYTDHTIDRSYPMIIDLERFTSDDIEQQLMEAMDYGDKNQHIAAEIKLKDLENGRTYTKYYNKIGYENWHVLTRLKLANIGAGSARAMNATAYVLIRHDDDTISRGNVQIRVVMPSS